MLVLLVLSRGSYHGRSSFYRKIHDDSLSGRCVRAFLEFSLFAQLYGDYAYYSNNRDKDRIPDHVKSLYSGASLAGYGDPTYSKGGEDLASQTRGLPLKLIREVLNQFQGTAGINVMEVGTANGDVVKCLADEYPHVNFIGVDLNVDNAKAYNGGNNITYVGAYAYDVLEQLRGEKKTIDFLFAISTFTQTTPLEFMNYMRVMRALEIRHILISGASMNGYRQIREGQSFSRHMEGHVWFHNYCGYLREFGYRIEHFDSFHFKHPRSETPDIFWHHIHAQLR